MKSRIDKNIGVGNESIVSRKLLKDIISIMPEINMYFRVP